MTGYGGGVANNVNLTLSAPGGFSLDSLLSSSANVRVPVGAFSVDTLLITDRATIDNPQTHVLIDQHNRSFQPADAQLYSEGNAFSFSMSGNMLTTDSFVIHSDPRHEVTTPAGTDSSVDRQGDVTLVKARLQSSSELPPDDDDEKDKPGELITISGVPVSLENGENSDWMQ